jgi:hypothetical protein
MASDDQQKEAVQWLVEVCKYTEADAIAAVAEWGAGRTLADKRAFEQRGGGRAPQQRKASK